MILNASTMQIDLHYAYTAVMRALVSGDPEERDVMITDAIEHLRDARNAHHRQEMTNE